MRQFTAPLFCSTLLAVSTPTWAEDWSVLVVGNPSATAPSAFADSFHVADALKSAGFSDVYLFRDQSGADLAAVLDTSLGAQQVMIYFAGDLAQTDSGMALVGADGNVAPTDLTSYMQRLSQSGTQTVVLMIEDCFAAAGSNGVRVPDSFGMNTFIASSAAEGSCPEQRMTDLILDMNGQLTLQAALSPAMIHANNVTDIALETTQPTQVIVASNDSGIDVVNRSNQDVISILPMASVSSGGIVEPVAFSQTAAPSGGQIGIQPTQQTPRPVILPDATGNQQAALPLREGYPEPSIIVGVIPNVEEFDRVDPNLPDVGAAEIAYDDLEARQAFRAENPDLFANLVEGGAFDPPQAALAAALQTELARMNCYRTRIDGDWGNGSRGAVDSYFAQAGGSAASREAVPELFRQIISADDVRCPTPVAQPAAARPVASSPSSGNSNPSRPAAAPSQAPAATPTPAPAPSGGGLGDVNLGGVFRG